MIKLGQLILFSKNVPRLTSFLSEFLELEIDNSNNAIRLVSEDFSFLLVERHDLPAVQNDLVIDFSVSSKEELVALKDKLEFLQYRYQVADVDGICKNISNKCEIRDLGSMQFFFFSDPDGRKWKVTHTLL